MPRSLVGALLFLLVIRSALCFPRAGEVNLRTCASHVWGWPKWIPGRWWLTQFCAGLHCVAVSVSIALTRECAQFPQDCLLLACLCSMTGSSSSSWCLAALSLTPMRRLFLRLGASPSAGCRGLGFRRGSEGRSSCVVVGFSAFMRAEFTSIGQVPSGLPRRGWSECFSPCTPHISLCWDLALFLRMWIWVKIKAPGIGPPVLVHVSICQGKPFWGYPIFDPLTGHLSSVTAN